MAETAPFDALDHLSADELRQRLRALEGIIARVPIPIAIAHDRECRFISANPALATLLHVPQNANVSMTPLTGAPLYRIQQNGHELPISELPMQYAIAHRTSVSNEIEIVRADGSVVYVQNDVEPLYDTHGDIYGCVSVCVDVTDRKKAELAFRDADRRKDEFLATLSHELRNPLAPIRSAVEVMRLAQGDQEIVEKARATIERQLLQLVRITDDLLDIARITQNKVQLKCARVDLLTVLHSAIEATRPLIDAQHHRLVLNLPTTAVWANADFTRLAQVFSNLLNNAAKYTDRGGEIRLSVSSEEAFTAVTVSDTGVGIEPDLLPRVFDMFRQLQEFRDRTHGGLGIGLTLAKRLVELHGGSIEAKSAGPGQGTTVVVRIPAVPVASGDVPPGDERGAAGRGPRCRVLVADDNPDAAEMMRMVLQMNGNDVRVAMDGERAVAMAVDFEPQIAFLDIGMPRVDGYSAARRIREALGDRVMLVALTGWGQDEDKRRSREAGFDHHLTKPPEPQVLERLITECAATRKTT